MGLRGTFKVLHSPSRMGSKTISVSAVSLQWQQSPINSQHPFLVAQRRSRHLSRELSPRLRHKWTPHRTTLRCSPSHREQLRKLSEGPPRRGGDREAEWHRGDVTSFGVKTGLASHPSSANNSLCDTARSPHLRLGFLVCPIAMSHSTVLSALHGSLHLIFTSNAWWGRYYY